MLMDLMGTSIRYEPFSPLIDMLELSMPNSSLWIKTSGESCRDRTEVSCVDATRCFRARAHLFEHVYLKVTGHDGEHMGSRETSETEVD